MKMFRSLLLIASLFLLLWSNAVASVQYRMIDLGIPSGFVQSRAYSVNDRGDIVGSIGLANGQYHSAIWKNGVMTDLGTMGGYLSWATGVNNFGAVTGVVKHENGKYYAYVLQNGEMTTLTSPDGGECKSAAIKDNGQVVGYSWSASSSIATRHATIWKDGIPVDLGTIGGAWSEASDSNANNEVVGYGLNSDGRLRAALWRDGVSVDIGLSNVYSAATGINDQGYVVGYYGSVIQGFVYDNESVTSLTSGEDSPTSAWDINGNGQVVGQIVESHTSPAFMHACLWQNGIVADLGSLGGTSWASAISDNGLIVGGSYAGDGSVHAVVWEPVPEPSSLLALFGGLGGMFVMGRRRKHVR